MSSHDVPPPSHSWPDSSFLLKNLKKKEILNISNVFLLLCLPSPARNRVSNLRVFDSNSVMVYFFVSIISLHSRGINLPRQSDSGIILPRQIDSVGLSWTYAALM